MPRHHAIQGAANIKLDSGLCCNCGQVLLRQPGQSASDALLNFCLSFSHIVKPVFLDKNSCSHGHEGVRLYVHDEPLQQESSRSRVWVSKRRQALLAVERPFWPVEFRTPQPFAQCEIVRCRPDICHAECVTVSHDAHMYLPQTTAPFVANHPSGHSFQTERALDLLGRHASPKPVELHGYSPRLLERDWFPFLRAGSHQPTRGTRHVILLKVSNERTELFKKIFTGVRG